MKYGLIILVVGVLVGAAVLLFSGSEPVTNKSSSGTTIVAFGDSLVTGVGATAGNDLVSILEQESGERIINLGVSGDTTADGLARIDTALAEDPKIVILLLGGNDFLRNVPEAETFANLEQIIERIHESGSAVLLLGVRGGVLRDNFKSEFSDLAKKHNTAFVSDVLSDIMTNGDLMADRIHPNNDGYEQIAARVLPELEALLAY